MDSLSCGVSCIKYILFVFNLIFAVLSIVIVAIGSVLVAGTSDLNNDLGLPIVLIVIGAVSFLIAFFGCCGAIRESSCLIYTYSAFVMILLIVQAIIGIVILVTIDDILAQVNTSVAEAWDNRFSNPRAWINIQRDYECCGLQNAGQWGLPLGNSCCATAPCTMANAFSTGCQVAVRDQFDQFARILAYIALGGAAVQLVGFIFAMILGHNIGQLN